MSDYILTTLLHLGRDCTPIVWRLALGSTLKRQYLLETSLEEDFKRNIDCRINAANIFVDVATSLSIAGISILFRMMFEPPTRKLVGVFGVIAIALIALVAVSIRDEVKRHSRELGKKRNLAYLITLLLLLVIEIIVGVPPNATGPVVIP